MSLSPGHRSVLTDTDSLRHSRASGAPLLFWPTRKSPRQATPPPRHREQQHGDWRRTKKQMATRAGNYRGVYGEGRGIPKIGGSWRPLCPRETAPTQKKCWVVSVNTLLGCSCWVKLVVGIPHSLTAGWVNLTQLQVHSCSRSPFVEFSGSFD